MRTYTKREIILIHEDTGERLDFESINSASNYLGTTFSNVQRAAIYNGVLRGWRVYESADAIRKHIDDLKLQLKVLEG